MLKTLEGNKTYIGLIAAGVLGILVSLGYADLSEPLWSTVAAIVGTWTGVAITHKANRAMKGGGQSARP